MIVPGIVEFTSLCRRLCAKLYLKAETQQVDRILDEFSRRYWDCNVGGLYGSASESRPSQCCLPDLNVVQVWFMRSLTLCYY